MRLRRTALPSAFLMLQPNRLRPRLLGRTKIVNSRPARRRPSRYTASYSARRTRRQSRGNPSPGASDARETVASFLAALRKDLASTRVLHACAEAVFLVTAAHMRLKGAFRQRSISSAGWPLSAADCPIGCASRPQANYVVYATAAARSRKPREPGRRVREGYSLVTIEDQTPVAPNAFFTCGWKR